MYVIKIGSSIYIYIAYNPIYLCLIVNEIIHLSLSDVHLC